MEQGREPLTRPPFQAQKTRRREFLPQRKQDRNRVMYKAAIGQAAVMVIDGVQWESAMPHNEKAVRRINGVVALLSGRLTPDGGVVLRLTRAERLEVTEAMDRHSAALALIVDDACKRFTPRHFQRLKTAAQTAYALAEHLNSLQS